MSMLLIRGTFKVSGGARPDGDTLPFIPDDVAEWRLVPGCTRILPGADGRAPVRLEGVDALETHYGVGEQEQHQPLEFAHRAADELLGWLGFTHVQRHDDETVTTVPEQVPGYILTRGTDAHGRCVALVGRRVPPAYSGYWIDVSEKQLKKTANYHLVASGLAYPTFYTGLPGFMRGVFSDAAQAARAATTPEGRGLWAADVTLTGAKITGMSSLTARNGAVILPKLFRRLKDYLDLNPEDPSLACFPAFLAGAADTYRIPQRPKQLTGLQHIVEISNGHTVRMTHHAEEIVFDEK
ncbi:nuclease [Streptomyces sp. NPDC059851]|uniref:nuclease n=1 Tax=Streptomyces sp. NPDC059851 TaxID=3346971 RepID=UPI0036471BBF